MNSIDLHTALMLALAGIVTALATGKLVRKIVLLPFEYLAKRTSTKVDDVLVEQAQKDLGVDPTLPAEDKKEQ